MSTWAEIEGALRAWVKSATAGVSSLADEKVYFAYQNNPRPAPPFITISLEDMTPVGLDSYIETTDLTRTAGQEVQVKTVGLRELSVSVQAFSTTEVGNATARAYLAAIQLAARSPGNQARFEAVGISIFDVGDVLNVPKVYETDTEGRAQLACRFYTNLELDEYTTYIETVEITGTIFDDSDLVIDAFEVP